MAYIMLLMNIYTNDVYSTKLDIYRQIHLNKSHIFNIMVLY